MKPGETVKRGQRIGAVGTTGQRAWPGYEHAQLELRQGQHDLEDPMPRMLGCFDGTKPYPGNRPVLTYPVKC